MNDILVNVKYSNLFFTKQNFSLFDFYLLLIKYEIKNFNLFSENNEKIIIFLHELKDTKEETLKIFNYYINNIIDKNSYFIDFDLNFSDFDILITGGKFLIIIYNI
jgi:hypothetical protein